MATVAMAKGRREYSTGSAPLSVADHRRDVAGLTYVYPVVSRRSGGVSIGINLNPNNACNWRCVYCQVPDLVRGGPPPLDLPRLEAELDGFLAGVTGGDWLERNVAPEARRLNDIAFSGNGEPTSAPEFDAAVEIVGRIAAKHGLAGTVKLVLITNGSLMHRAHARRGVARMAGLNGEVWFKFDAGSAARRRLVNGSPLSDARVLANLADCAKRCPTWLQTCAFAWDGEPPDDRDRADWLDLARRALDSGVRLEGVLLYGLARPSLQPEAPRLARLPLGWLESWAADMRALGLAVKVSE